jgi:hypothetical protein
VSQKATPLSSRQAIWREVGWSSYGPVRRLYTRSVSTE